MEERDRIKDWWGKRSKDRQHMSLSRQAKRIPVRSIFLAWWPWESVGSWDKPEEG